MSNEGWIEARGGSWAHRDQLVTANRWSDYQAVTLADIKAMARRWLVAEPLTIIVQPKVLAAPTAPPRPPGRRGRR